MSEQNILKLMFILFVKKISKYVAKLLKIDSNKNIVDILTKGLPFPQHKLFYEKLGMFDPFQVVT